MPSLCPIRIGTVGLTLPSGVGLGAAMTHAIQELSPVSSGSLPTVLGALPATERWFPPGPLEVLLAKASLLHTKAQGLLILEQDRGKLVWLSFHSLQLHVPREMPEACEGPLCELGTQPGPRAYGVWVPAATGSGSGWGLWLLWQVLG